MFEGGRFFPISSVDWHFLLPGSFFIWYFIIISFHMYISAQSQIHSLHLYDVTSQQQAEGMLVELQVNVKVYNISVSQNTNLCNHLDN